MSVSIQEVLASGQLRPCPPIFGGNLEAFLLFGIRKLNLKGTHATCPKHIVQSK